MWPDAYSEPCQASKIECFAEILNSFQPLNICALSSILDALQVSEYASI